jgi:ERCC4-type nuclease
MENNSNTKKNMLEVQICIDNRERDLHKQIQYYLESLDIFSNQSSTSTSTSTSTTSRSISQKIPLTISSKPLSLGDVIIKVVSRCESHENGTSNEVEELIIERKSIQDLLSSIKDGRYEEQSYRLNGCDIHNHNIIYLVEGNILLSSANNYAKHKNNNDKFTAYSAIFSLNYYKGFSVIRTFSLEESALFICNCANKLRKGIIDKKKPYYVNNITKRIESTQENDNDVELHNVSNESSASQYTHVIKKVKKENITPVNIGEIMLCQIPGISSITAVVIMNKFHTIDYLIQNIKEHGDTCLKDITYTNNNKTRKISKSSVENIIKFLGN